ncbi:MAG: hypothetical protein SFZ23_10040 [Planctomycetota bacterium]|nr:hypothetical protein [Planctomycetota bacterium]
MTLDQRQTQIREGAGLEESRLNQDFIDFLRRWSTPLLLVVVLASGGYVLYQRYNASRVAEVNAAFRELEAAGAASASANAEALLRVAEDYKSVPGVGTQARLRAAEVYLRALRTGLKPGAVLKPDGTPESPEELLTAEDRTWYTEQAQGLFKRVADDTYGKSEMVLHRIRALFGLAAVAETMGEFDGAKAFYEDVIATTDQTTFAAQAEVARQRIAELDAIRGEVTLISSAQLPKLPSQIEQEARAAAEAAAAEAAAASQGPLPAPGSPGPPGPEAPAAPGGATPEAPAPEGAGQPAGEQPSTPTPESPANPPTDGNSGSGGPPK